MIELSIIAPIYNEAENIENLYNAITNVMNQNLNYEIILVNDGSTDNSTALLDRISYNNPLVHVIHFKKNRGQTAALWAGMKAAKGELLAIIDADLQTDPKDIFTLLPYMKDYDFANGKRTSRQDTFIKKVSSKVGNGVRNFITDDSIEDTGCPMKLLKREVADSYYLFEGMHRFLPTLAKMNGYRVIEVSVTHRERKFGASKYGIFNRAFVGLMDAIVVGWLKKRFIHYQIRK